jgi:hypothetical protein
MFNPLFMVVYPKDSPQAHAYSMGCHIHALVVAMGSR